MTVSITNVSFAYGQKQALSDLCFDIPKGRFCALLGPNGAGKSTLFGLMTRLLQQQHGQITVGSHDLKKDPLVAMAKLGVVFQETSLDLDLTVQQNMRYGAALHGLSGRQAGRRIDQALDQLGIRDRVRETVRNLNGGHRRRLEIARALVPSPEVLLLDEPTVGLDIETRRAVTRDVHALCNEGHTALWATHLVDEIAPSDQVVILHQGRARQLDRATEPVLETFLALTTSEKDQP